MVPSVFHEAQSSFLTGSENRTIFSSRPRILDRLSTAWCGQPVCATLGSGPSSRGPSEVQLPAASWAISSPPKLLRWPMLHIPREPFPAGLFSGAPSLQWCCNGYI
jgi:hypothetical protein